MYSLTKGNALLLMCFELLNLKIVVLNFSTLKVLNSFSVIFHFVIKEK